MRSLAFLAALLLASLAGAQEAAEERGLALALENCARCHDVGHDVGNDAGHDAGSHPAAPPFRELHERYPVEHLAEALVEGIVTGHPDMPELQFEPEEAEDLIAYLRSLK